MSWLTSMFARQETPEQRAKWIDDTVAMVGRKVVTQAMEQISHAKRALDIATDTPFTEAWIGASGGINADIANGQWTAVKRSRDLARNYDYARGYLHRLDDIVLGRTGIRCQVRMTKRDGTSAREVNNAIEAAWRRFGRRGNCDITGKFSWRDIERLQLSALARDGEFLARLVPGIGRHRFVVQLLQPELLDVNCNRVHAGRRVRMGIELNDANRPVAYWLLAQADGADLIQMGRHVRVPAEQIVHAFMAEEPEQLRGYPWMAAGGRRLWMLKEYEEAAAAASANAAKRFGFFQATVDAAEPMNPIVTAVVSEAITAAKAAGKELTAEEQKRLFDAATKYTTTVTGQFDTLPPGYTFEPFKSDYPHVNYGEYTKECKRGFASGVGMSYVTTGNDLESVNYSSAQVGVLDEREHLMTVRDWLAEAWHQRVMTAWLPWAMVAEPALARLNPSRIDEYLEAVSWQTDQRPLDPVKAAEANERNLKSNLTSRRRVIFARGDDPDEIDAEIAADPMHPSGEFVAPAPDTAADNASGQSGQQGRKIRVVENRNG